MYKTRKIVAGNWKMNPDNADGTALASAVASLADDKGLLTERAGVDIIVFPPFIMIPACMAALGSHSRVAVGAQNCHAEAKGAFTGEVSAPMLKAAGLTHVLIGHSERRAYFGEDHSFLQKKTDAVLQHGLKPVFCCGEVVEQRKEEKHFDVVKQQLSESLFHLDARAMEHVIIAYEPVWAIGTGLTASPEQAQEMHEFIRSLLQSKYGRETALRVPLLYGGSCNAKNAAELFANPDVDGGLIGGASLKAEEFVEIAAIASKISCQI